jgi:hypothetical protein
LADFARNVIQLNLNPCFLSDMASYDVASDICQAVRLGTVYW